MTAFLRQLRQTVRDESASIRKQIHQQWAQSVAARVAEGHAIDGVRVVASRQDGALLLGCDQNDSRFREGDILLLNRGDPFEPPHLLVTLEEEDDDDNCLWVLVEDVGVNWGEVARQPTGWVLDEGFLDLSHYLLDALNEAADTAAGREQILPLLTEMISPALCVHRYEYGLEYAAQHGLNEEQAEALACAYATNLTYLIQGPPGTGKTRVLAHLAKLRAAEGERVLLTALTHRAINHALNTLVEIAPDITAAKIGQPVRADDLNVTSYETFDHSPLAALEQGYVVGATPFATRTGRLRNVSFDTVIFDEASQITLPLAVMGMLAAKRSIFIGDHKQLPPVFAARHGGIFRESVFGTLVGRGFDTMLTQTYRMNAELTAWPSRQFYAGHLQPASAAIATRRIAYPQPPAHWSAILNPDLPRVFVALPHQNTRTRSQREARLIAELVSALLACGMTPEQLGIIAPFRAQGREIRTQLGQVLPNELVRKQVIIDTVERMQGQERDLIILSLTTANPTFAARLAEFFFQPERLNVAITRARSKLIIVGSRHVLHAMPDDPSLQAHVALLADLLNTCVLHNLDHER
jgi:DNA replication ATP-dependent helicase Dna2